MVDVETGRFTVGVFQDAAWAEKGLKALTQAGFVPDSLTVLVKDSVDAGALFTGTFGTAADRLELAAVGGVLARGPLVKALQGAGHDLAKLGLSGTMRRVGFPQCSGRNAT